MPRPEDLHVLREEPPIAETPHHVLAEYITPSASVYVRSNFATPALGHDHQLRVGGAVRQSFDVDLGGLQQMESKSIVMTMECAGNDRLGLRPVPEGEAWNHGAVSTVEFTGVSLGALLDRAGVANDAIEVVAVGADRGVRDGHAREIPYARSLPLAVARDADTLVAYAMNGNAISPVHGAPFRLVVPRWYGMANVKWLRSLEAVVEPFVGHFQNERYVYDVDGVTTPVTTMRVKSFIASPPDDAEVDAGVIAVAGWAWSGDGHVTAVEVSVGDGPWVHANVEPVSHEYAWRHWTADVSIPAGGSAAIRSRAMDSSGAVQPESIVWNRLGYGNNAIRSITVHVK